MPQNDPACVGVSEEAQITLDLTIDENDALTIEAPYQDMCAPDFFCAVSGPSCPVPTSYSVPQTKAWSYYDPRPTDGCRTDKNGAPVQVTSVTEVTGDGRSTLVINQLCQTQMRNDIDVPTSYVFDERDWTTVIQF